MKSLLDGASRLGFERQTVTCDGFHYWKDDSPVIVMKFGGTSVRDADAIRRVRDIVSGRAPRRPVVVVSAMAGVTDDLLEIAGLGAARGLEEALDRIRRLKSRHIEAAESLAGENFGLLEKTRARISDLFAGMERLIGSVATLGELTARSKDAIVAHGEDLSSCLVATAFQDGGLRCSIVDSRSFLVTDDRFTCASPELEQTGIRARRILDPILERGEVAVTQGFIGATLEGITTTVGRGGSDFSAAIIGSVLGAEAIEIWTDVDGLMSADPRIVPGARRIRVISFAEASELSYFGARVLHPSTLLPAVEKSIPVHIFNTMNPESEGTVILAEARPSTNVIKSISCKRGVTIVNVTSTRMLHAYGFLRAIFSVFEKHRTPVDVVTTSEVSVSMTVERTVGLPEIEKELSEIGSVMIDSGKAIVCVVGHQLKFTPGVAARLFSAIHETNVNMISQGASEINLTFVIDEGEVEGVVQRLHEEFMSDPDPDAFG